MNVQVIKKKEGRVDRNSGLVINSRLRVTAYCRVSTGDEEQLNSYESQKKYYKEKITSNSNWYFTEIYADEAISGTLDYKRTDFMRMIQDALDNKFDMILTKSISRFARNTVDTLKYVRILKERNIAVLFEEENINTLEMSGELLLTILSSVAQQESENVSTHVKLGLKMKKQRGELVGFNNCLGYSYDAKSNKMIINQEEADIVREIFSLYLKGYGSNGIAKKLTELQIKTPKGNKKWNENSILRILKNEKYKGDVLQGKTFTTDPITHKRVINMGEEDQYYITEHHEAIIDEETFNKVQRIIKERRGARATGRILGNVGRKFTFSSRLRCGFCGKTLGRRSLYVNKKQTKPAWLCITSFKSGKQYCPDSKVIREEIIENAFIDSYKLLCNNKNTINKLLDNIEKASKENSFESQIDKLESNKVEIEQKKQKLLDLMIEGTITQDIYNERLNQYNDKQEKIEMKIDKIKAEIKNDNGIEKGIAKFKEILKNEDIMEEFDSDVFDAIVDYVIIGGYTEDGQKDQYMIRFICKSKFRLSNTEEVTKEKIISNSHLDTSEYNVILDFVNRQSFMLFERDENGKMNKRIIDKIRVRVEMDT